MEKARPLVVIRQKEVCRRLGGIGKSTLYRRLASEPGFPQKLDLGGRVVGWDEREVDEYIERKKKSRVGPTNLSRRLCCEEPSSRRKDVHTSRHSEAQSSD